MDSFLAFVLVVIGWIASGSWGTSILTRKNYLAPDSPQIAPGSDVVRRMGPRSVSPQIVLSFLGPIVLIAALMLPPRS